MLCDCERDFSGAGYVSQERSQLKPSAVDDFFLVFWSTPPRTIPPLNYAKIVIFHYLKQDVLEVDTELSSLREI